MAAMVLYIHLPVTTWGSRNVLKTDVCTISEREGVINSRLSQGKNPKLWISASLFEYLKGSVENHHSESLRDSLTPHLHKPHQQGSLILVWKRCMFKTPHFPRYLVRGLLRAFSRSSALKLTCRRASRCLFLGLLSASSSASWVPPATQGGLPSSLPCHLSVDKSLHWSKSGSRSYSLFMESYLCVKLQVPGQVRTFTHESYYIAPWPKYLG